MWVDPTIQEQAVIEIALSQVGVCEVPPGSNRGPMVDQYLASVNLGPGYPWCAAFVSWVIFLAEEQLGESIALPRSGWAAAFAGIEGFTLLEETQFLAPGQIFTLWYPDLDGGRVGHVGFVLGPNEHDPAVIDTIEGNTNSKGGREGIEVAIKHREIAHIFGFTDYGDRGYGQFSI